MKPNTFTTLTIITTILLSKSHGANILFFFHLGTYSHRITAWPLVEALVEKGHSVTFLMPEKNKNPNPKVKVLEITPKTTDWGDGSMDLLQRRIQVGPALQSLLLSSLIPTIATQVCEYFLNDPEIIDWINSSHYDLVVVDAVLNDCAYGLAYKWKAKTILFSTSSVFDWIPDAVGLPVESSWIPNLHYGYFTTDVPMPFFGRILSTFAHLFFRFSVVLGFHRNVEPLLREKLGIPDMPPIAELEVNVSLVLMNTHFSEELARSLPPLVVSIGGMHCTTKDKTKPLSKDMEDFINESAENGFIYVSFGSAAKFRNETKAISEQFFKAFRNTKTRFLWKWEGTRPENMPKNVFTAPWMPQQAILAHPKIRVFITHGGLLSMQEAVFNGVPMISFPIFAEQDYNAERLHRTKRGIRLEISSVTQEDIEGAINSILTDKTYLNNVRKASRAFKDRPETPLEKALWWTEYVLRHDDTSFLRPLSISQTWYERRLLDVWAFIFAVIFIVLWLIVFVSRKIVSFVVRKCIGSKEKKPKKFKIKKQ